MFYGWWIVAASVMTGLYSAGVVFYGFTAFFEPIADEMGWSYTQISLAASLRGLEMGIMAPLMGILADRWGPRRLVFGGVLFTVAGLFVLSRTVSLPMFYAGFGLMAIGISASNMTVLMTAVANWFRKKVGMATGIAVCGFGLGGFMVPLVVKLIELYQWRLTMSYLALGMLVAILPLSLVFRHRPEQYGYLLDGEEKEPVVAESGLELPPVDDIEEMTVKRALRSGAFWRLALAFTYHVMVVTAAVTHVMPYLSSIGINRSVSALAATAIPVMSIAGRLGLGWLGDRIGRKPVTVGALAITGLGLVFFGYIAQAGIWLLAAFLMLFSIGYGGINALRPSLGREFFGRTNFGTIFGIIIGINMIGGIAGPAIAGWVYDSSGSYQGIWVIFGLLAVVAIASVWTVSPVGKATVSPAKS
ncbi:MAG: MFS transporter [Dehalococcoidales bacterium]|nr:MFS transporter [Dehalococcoidales bacterium]